MRLKVPVTGRVLDYDPVAGQLDGLGVIGDPNDPVRLVNINLGNVSWRLVSIDIENDLAEIEVTPGKYISIVKDGGTPDNPGDWVSRPATKKEKQEFLDNVKQIIESKTTDELYAMSGSRRLVKPAGIEKRYKKNPPSAAARERLLAQG